MTDQTSLREHLAELLRGRSAHVDLETAVGGFPMNLINERVDAFPHSPWELLEHIRIAQWDIVEFCRSAGHRSPDFPDGYWDLGSATVNDWVNSAQQISRDLNTMRQLVADEGNDLFAAIPHGEGQTLLREALVLADHNAYHLGQLMLLKKSLEGGDN